MAGGVLPVNPFPKNREKADVGRENRPAHFQKTFANQQPVSCLPCSPSREVFYRLQGSKSGEQGASREREDARFELPDPTWRIHRDLGAKMATFMDVQSSL
jgi:hypothetical protein